MARKIQEKEEIVGYILYSTYKIDFVTTYIYDSIEEIETELNSGDLDIDSEEITGLEIYRLTKSSKNITISFNIENE